MKKSEFQERKKKIKSLYESGDTEIAEDKVRELVLELHVDKNYAYTVDLYHSGSLQLQSVLGVFEVAYALSEQGYTSEAEEIYEYIVSIQPKDSAALNNLSNIKKEKGEVDKAFELIQRAYELDPEDEIISRNYENILASVQEKEEIIRVYQHALTYLSKENEFVIQKLQAFFSSANKDRGFKNNQMPIPRWKFKVMMGTDEQKATSLLDQWLKKGYLRRTGERGTFHEHIYEINPFLLKEIAKLKPKKLNPQWMRGIERLNADELEAISYFDTIKLVRRVKKSIRSILLRDLDELFLNYVMGNDKAVVILSGSIVEILLIYYCEKKKVKNISYQRQNKTITKKLYDCNLGDLLAYYEQNKILGDIVLHMGNISRIYRNFVHPGKELREQVTLDQAKANLCFVSALEIVKRACI